MENQLSVAGGQLSVAGHPFSVARTRKVFKASRLCIRLNSMDGILCGAACKVFKRREMRRSLTPLNRILCNFALVSCCMARLYFFYFFSMGVPCERSYL